MNMRSWLGIVAGLMSFTLGAQEIRYTEAAFLPVFGKVSENTSGRYERLLVELKGVSRDPVWYLGRIFRNRSRRDRFFRTSIS